MASLRKIEAIAGFSEILRDYFLEEKQEKSLYCV